MKKKLSILLILCLFITGILSGCKEEDHSGELTVYYLNLDGSQVQADYFDPAESGESEEVDQYLYALTHDPENSDLRKAIPDSISVLDCNKEDYLVEMNFSKEYYSLSKNEEVLVRAAVVRTMTQCKDVSYVTFSVEGEALKDGHDNVIGAMSADTFVENADEAINTNQKAKLTLYFASSDGTYLVEENRTVYYNTSESIEKLVVEKLIDGPKTDGLQATLPSSTKIINISVNDGICYVNLDSGFNSQNQEITEDVVLFSLVDSLTSLDEVDHVQLSIDGDNSGKVRYIYDLSQMYEWNEEVLIPSYDLYESTEE